MDNTTNLNKSNKQTKLRNILVITNTILLIGLIALIYTTNTTLSLHTIEKEITSTFGKDYILTPYDIGNNNILLSVSTPNKIEIDYTENVNKFINNLNDYKANTNINGLILRFEYHDGDTKYIHSEYEIGTLKFY